MRLFTWLGASVLCHGTAVVSTPMTKIVSLLGAMENQLEEQGAKEAALHNEFNAWCDTESQESRTTISDAQSKIADLEAFLKEQEAFRDKMKSEVNGLVGEIAANEEELKQAVEIRKKEHQSYLQNEQAFVETLDEVNRTLEVLRADGPKGSTRRSMAEIQQAVRHCLERTTLQFNRADKSTLESFFRATSSATAPAAPTPNNSFMQQTSSSLGAAAAPFQSQLAPLIELVDLIRTDTEKNRNLASEDEERSGRASQLMNQSLGTEIESGKKALSIKQAEVAQSTERSSQKQAEVTETSYILKETTKYLNGVYGDCRAKAREWKERVKLRSDELTAIGEAKRILTSEAAKRIQASTPTAFLQLQLEQQQAPVRRHSVDPLINIMDSKNTDAAVMSFLETTVKMADRTRDPFASVRKMIQGMLSRLFNAAADEKDQKAWCDEEMAKTTKQQDIKNRDITKLTNRVDEMDATMSQLSDELAQLNKDLSEMNQTAAEATEIRTKERTAAELAIKEYGEAQSLLQNAMSVLQDFYAEKQSMLQNNAGPPPAWDEDAGTQEDKASGVIGLLEIALADFQKLEQEARISENAAEGEYKTLMNESQVRKAVFTKNVEYKSTGKVKLASALQRSKADLQGYQRELAAVEEYFKKLQPSCTVKSESFEERAARRKQEIESLQEALQILNEQVM